MKIFKLILKQKIIKIISLLPDKILEKSEKAIMISRGKGFNFSNYEIFKNVLSLLKNIKTFVDIGAHDGLYTDFILKEFPNSKGFLFEPDKINFNLLKKKYKKKNIIISNYALSNRKQITYLYSNKIGSPLGSLYKRKLEHINIRFNKIQKIKTFKMIDYYKKKINSVVDFCKIDIEGNELNCLIGFEKSLKLFRYIQFEFNGCNIDSKTFFKDFWYFFKKQKFNIYRMSPYGPRLIKNYSDEEEFFGMNNFIAENKRYSNTL